MFKSLTALLIAILIMYVCISISYYINFNEDIKFFSNLYYCFQNSFKILDFSFIIDIYYNNIYSYSSIQNVKNTYNINALKSNFFSYNNYTYVFKIIYVIYIMTFLIGLYCVSISIIIVLFEFSNNKELKYQNFKYNITSKFDKINSDIDIIIENFVNKRSNKSKHNQQSNNKIYPQILWLDVNYKLNNNSEFFFLKVVSKFYSNNNFNILHFTSSNQIVNYLSFIFSIKPKFQFINTTKRFILIIQINNLKDDISKLDIIINFINYSNCKIKTIFYFSDIFLSINNKTSNNKATKYDKLNLQNACKYEVLLCHDENELENQVKGFISYNLNNLLDENESNDESITTIDYIKKNSKFNSPIRKNNSTIINECNNITDVDNSNKNRYVGVKSLEIKNNNKIAHRNSCFNNNFLINFKNSITSNDNNSKISKKKRLTFNKKSDNKLLLNEHERKKLINSGNKINNILTNYNNKIEEADSEEDSSK